MILILNVSAINIRNCYIICAPDKISVALEFPLLKLFPQLRKLSKYFSSRYAFHYPPKCLLKIFSNFTNQYILLVCQCPYQMVFQIIYCVLNPSYYHATVISSSLLLRQLFDFRRFSATYFTPARELVNIP